MATMATRYAIMRHAMHEPYKGFRAIDCKQLHMDYLRTTENREELDLSADSDADSLWKACFRGQMGVAQRFLDQGADVNERGGSNGSSTLGWAAQNHHIDVCHLLLENGARLEDANRNGRTPLWIASQNGFLEIVKLLLDRGASVNSPDSNNSTPLYMSCKRNNVEVVKHLIARGADLNVRSSFGTAVERATELGYAHIVDMLRNAGAAE